MHRTEKSRKRTSLFILPIKSNRVVTKINSGVRLIPSLPYIDTTKEQKISEEERIQMLKDERELGR